MPVVSAAPPLAAASPPAPTTPPARVPLSVQPTHPDPRPPPRDATSGAAAAAGRPPSTAPTVPPSAAHQSASTSSLASSRAALRAVTSPQRLVTDPAAVCVAVAGLVSGAHIVAHGARLRRPIFTAVLPRVGAAGADFGMVPPTARALARSAAASAGAADVAALGADATALSGCAATTSPQSGQAVVYVVWPDGAAAVSVSGAAATLEIELISAGRLPPPPGAHGAVHGTPPTAYLTHHTVWPDGAHIAFDANGVAPPPAPTGGPPPLPSGCGATHCVTSDSPTFASVFSLPLPHVPQVAPATAVAARAAAAIVAADASASASRATSVDVDAGGYATTATAPRSSHPHDVPPLLLPAVLDGSCIGAAAALLPSAIRVRAWHRDGCGGAALLGHCDVPIGSLWVDGVVDRWCELLSPLAPAGAVGEQREGSLVDTAGTPAVRVRVSLCTPREAGPSW